MLRVFMLSVVMPRVVISLCSNAQFLYSEFGCAEWGYAEGS
jgi:hypothetical protein